jgi:hypothetical protein
MAAVQPVFAASEVRKRHFRRRAGTSPQKKRVNASVATPKNVILNADMQ